MSKITMLEDIGIDQSYYAPPPQRPPQQQPPQNTTVRLLTSHVTPPTSSGLRNAMQPIHYSAPTYVQHQVMEPYESVTTLPAQVYPNLDLNTPMPTVPPPPVSGNTGGTYYYTCPETNLTPYLLAIGVLSILSIVLLTLVLQNRKP